MCTLHLRCFGGPQCDCSRAAIRTLTFTQTDQAVKNINMYRPQNDICNYLHLETDMVRRGSLGLVVMGGDLYLSGQ